MTPKKNGRKIIKEEKVRVRARAKEKKGTTRRRSENWQDRRGEEGKARRLQTKQRQQHETR